MTNRSPSFFRRIYVMIFLLIVLLGILFMVIAYLASTSFYETSTQLLNKDVAGHIATFTSPFGQQGFDRQRADSVFYQAMVISPSVEVYFLDTTGRVIDFHGPASDIKTWQLPLTEVFDYIRAGGVRHIRGPDPRDPGHKKIFSAAAVEGSAGRLGYIYVIIGSRQYRTVTQMLYNSQVVPTVMAILLCILACSLVVTILYVRRIRSRFEGMMEVPERFRAGDLTARFTLQDQDELSPVAGAFNLMADLLLENIRRVTDSEKERKDFMVNISHDLRTPLAVASGYAETLVLKQDILTEYQKTAYATVISEKIRRVENMVNQLFELSKMESASFEPRREPLIFLDILLETIQSVASSDGIRDSRVDSRECIDSSWVEADVSMIERVVQNLLVNALSYTPEGGHIWLSLKRDGNELEFRIENEGIALAADLLEWMNAQNSRPPRTAIGLTIIRKVLRLHHFRYQVETSAGINTFWFRMPLYIPLKPGE